jgi:hypothetical protein
MRLQFIKVTDVVIGEGQFSKHLYVLYYICLCDFYSKSVKDPSNQPDLHIHNARTLFSNCLYCTLVTQKH